MPLVYVLRLTGGKYYVGRTTKLQFRMEDHLPESMGRGALWTTLYPPQDIVEILVEPEQGLLELATTIKYMSRYGIDNVRGALFTSRDLTDEQREQIKMLQCSAEDKCYKCEGKGHVAADCPNPVIPPAPSQPTPQPQPPIQVAHRNPYPPKPKSQSVPNTSSRGDFQGGTIQCWRCKKFGHMADSCFVTLPTSSSSKKYYESLSDDSDDERCYQCGKKGHWAFECYSSRRSKPRKNYYY
jgi:predicted GIY-YIG superfamily endonuclease